MKTNSGTIELKNSTIVCDDWRQLLDNEWVRLTFCPNDLIPGSCEGFIRLVNDKENNIIFFETNGNIEYISELYMKIYPNSIMYYTDYFKSDRPPCVIDIRNVQDIFEAFNRIDYLLTRSDLLLPFI